MNGRLFTKISAAIALLSLAGCGTFQLSSGAIPLTPKTQEQMQLDNLSCKDQAKLEANTASRQAGAFALGFTVVGAPIAFELEKAKQREVYKTCMERRGYRVLPPNDGATTSQTPSQSTNQLRQAQPEPQSNATGKDEAAQLQRLRELREKGLITAEEHERKRKEILDRL